MEDLRFYWYWLNHIAGVGNVKIRKLLSDCGEDPMQIYASDAIFLRSTDYLSEAEITEILSESRREAIKREYEDFLRGETRFVVPTDEAYPRRLLELYDKPFILYYRGSLPQEERLAVSIVGSRRCSEYGQSIARELAVQLAGRGVDVISGLALGIDSEAHRGALYAGGITHAILAGGAGTCYPLQNFNLYMDIIERGGGILSEYPDNVATKPGMFPVRNRIISGLSDAVIVVEAGHKSGSLITATLAAEQNRDVYAVPGRLGDPAALGCNELIGEGARIISSVERLLEDLAVIEPDLQVKNPTAKRKLSLAPLEKMLYSQLLDFTPKSLETLLSATGLTVSQSLEALIALEIKGFIREIGKNFYVRVF